MIVCKNCGHQNEDNDTFCGSCGKFLEWTGERVVAAQPEPEPPPPAPAPEPEPARLGLIDRVKHAVGIEEVAAQQTPPPAAPTPVVDPAPAAASAPMRSVPVMSSAPPAAPVAPTQVPPAPRQPVGAAPVGSAAPVAAPEPVLAGVGAPVTPSAPGAGTPSDEPMSRRPTSVAPTVTRPRPAPRTMEPPTRRHPGDLICGQCGEGNDPIRHFCRRCGNSLDEAMVVSLPWYRRFLNRVFPSRRREAGWRPRRVGAPNVMGMVMRIIRWAIVAVIVLAALAFLLRPNFRTTVIDRVTAAVTSVRKIVLPRLDPVHPVGATATSNIPGHGADLAIDTFNNTYWGASTTDHSPTLIVHFAGPVDLADIGFSSGASGTAPTDQFLAQPRPHVVHLVFSNGTTADLSLKDEDPKAAKNAQFYSIDAKQVTFVEIHILSMWPTAGPAPTSVAISEVEFRIKD